MLFPSIICNKYIQKNSIIYSKNKGRSDLTKLRIKDCRGLKSFRGLMFSRKDGALLGKPFYHSSGINIWTPFVPKLDLFFLSSDYKIIKKRCAAPLSLNPTTWKIYGCTEAFYCLEVKSGLNLKLTQEDVDKIIRKLDN